MGTVVGRRAGSCTSAPRNVATFDEAGQSLVATEFQLDSSQGVFLAGSNREIV